MKFSREYIIQNAFLVFLDRGYDSTSITILQQELKMSRGAMYRYFKNKEDLFMSVIDEYFFKPYHLMLHIITKNEQQKLSELIELNSLLQKRFIEAISNREITRASFLNYTALMIQAAKYYPDFIFRMKRITTSIRKSWRDAIERSMEEKEIRDDVNVNVLARLFSAMTNNESSEQNEQTFAKHMSMSFKNRKESMEYLFSLIKI